MNERFKEIIEQALAVWAEDFPAEPDDPTAWHFTDKDIRSLLACVVERVEEQMLDAVEVGRHMGQLSIERNEARSIAERCYNELDSIKRLRIGGLPWRRRDV